MPCFAPALSFDGAPGIIKYPVYGGIILAGITGVVLGSVATAVPMAVPSALGLAPLLLARAGKAIAESDPRDSLRGRIMQVVGHGLSLLTTAAAISLVALKVMPAFAPALLCHPVFLIGGAVIVGSLMLAANIAAARVQSEISAVN